MPLLTRIPSTEGYQCRHRQGYYPQRSISVATGKDTIHREVSVPSQARILSTEKYQCRHRQGYHLQRCISATISKDIIHRDESVLSQARMLPQKHQCFPATTLEQGCSDQGHQCSQLNCIWMTPDMVPTRTIHHRFLVLKKPNNLTIYLCPWCRDKSTWRQPMVYIVETGITVFEVN